MWRQGTQTAVTVVVAPAALCGTHSTAWQALAYSMPVPAGHRGYTMLLLPVLLLLLLLLLLWWLAAAAAAACGTRTTIRQATHSVVVPGSHGINILCLLVPVCMCVRVHVCLHVCMCA